jgi:hypothetical protein
MATNKYASLDLGTIEAVFNKLGGLEGAKRFLQGAVELVIKSVLTLLNAAVASKEVKDFNPDTFYQTRKGLWVSDEFNSRVLSKAKSVKKLPATTLKALELAQDATDDQIIAGLPENYEWDVSEALARIASMIEAQPEGKEGDLVNNGYANLFYVPGCVVYVHWNADNRGWGVYVWDRGDDRWGAGCRVFSRN